MYANNVYFIAFKLHTCHENIKFEKKIHREKQFFFTEFWSHEITSFIFYVFNENSLNHILSDDMVEKNNITRVFISLIMFYGSKLLGTCLWLFMEWPLSIQVDFDFGNMNLYHTCCDISEKFYAAHFLCILTLFSILRIYWIQMKWGIAVKERRGAFQILS